MGDFKIARQRHTAKFRVNMSAAFCTRASLLMVLSVFVSTAVFGALPIAGPVVPELRVIDDAVQGYMVSHKFEAGTLALMKDSRLVLRQGYGWRDGAKSVVTHPDNLFRLASVAKMPTASAITKLIRDGKLTKDTKVVPLLGVAPWGGVLGDPRLNDITVQMVLDHQGGWDSAISPIGNIVDRTVQISTEMGLNHPASSAEVISWVFSKKLDFTPGSRSAYSNFGFQVLARVIEKVSGKSFLDYLDQDLLGLLGVRVILSRSRPADRDPWEIWYKDDLPLMRTAVDFPSQNLVKYVDGGNYYESVDACGGLTASAPALCRYLLNYWEGGDRRDPLSGYTWIYTFYGGAPATTTVLYQNIQQNSGVIQGLEFAALFNGNLSNVDNGGDARTAILGAVDSVTSWPSPTGGTVQWAADFTEVSKRAGTVTILLQRSGGNTTVASVSYATYARSADSLDFVSTTGAVSFAAGETVKPVTLTILDNSRLDSVREFSVELVSVAGGASLGDRVSSTIRILNNTGNTALRLANNSTRVMVGTGENVLVTGIVLAGAGAKSYLVRGIGPSLAKFGVTGALSNPILKIFDSKGQVVASNNGWDPSLASTFTATGAFALPAGSVDAALMITLGPGAYTIQISGAGNSSGVALAEIYELP